MTEQNTNLKPCPFCGFEAVLESESREGGMCAPRWRVKCSRDCVASRWLDGDIHESGFGYINVEVSVKKHLEYFWNTRG